MFQKTTIAQRLLLGFGAVVGLLVAIVAVGLAYLNSLTRQVDVLANDRIPQVIAAGRLEASVLRASRGLQTVFELTEATEQQGQLAALKAAREEQANLAAQMRRLAATDQSRALLAQIDQARKAWVKTESEIIAQLESGQTHEAKVLLLTKARTVQGEYQTAITKLSAFYGDEAHQLAQESTTAYRRSIGAFVVAALLCIAAAIGVALLISRSIRAQLGGEPDFVRSMVKRVADGDLTVKVQLGAGDQHSLMAAMREMVTSLRAIAGETARGAQAVADTSAQIAQGNLDLSQRTEEQASTLEETASSMEELTVAVQHNAQNAKQASALASEASETARKGGLAVDDVVSTMDEILDSSKKIGDIIGVIDSIAFQTNILALNAAVEAARAGEQGRGFAVVATEVRNLAHRSAAAAKEIKALIADSTNKVQAGSSRVDAAGHTMTGVVLSVKKVTDLIAEIAAQNQEQSLKIAQVGTAVRQMDTVVQQNASLVEEAAAATESMKDQAGTLLAIVSRFRLEDAPRAEASPATLLETAKAAAEPAPIRMRPAAVPYAPGFKKVEARGWKGF
ncbi:methyl-accepting chemotaxis protein [Ramlibacter solisilvae]|uniref:methyl-accepting chemotaxis protein n=1 Tax=Ramlibacter tataouinensis TaxID=94132 RepID=UPI000776DCB0|nr:methyl-accepting chemotaxis protein [Ramlibacter tataouinensis]